MRKINNDFNKIPPELQTCANKNETDLVQNNETRINVRCYKKSKKALEKQFYKKCAYCETNYTASSDTWIEHYRPKTKYYWLTYEWSNLLPPCIKCKRTKRDNFPLINELVQVKLAPITKGQLNKKKLIADQAPLINEEPYIIHPKIDNPEKFLDFELDPNYEGIKIIGTDNKKRGKTTIQICALNRPELIDNRYTSVISTIIETFEKTLEKLMVTQTSLFKFYDAFVIDFKDMEDNAEKNNIQHTLLRKKILNIHKFEEIICPSIENKILRKYILSAYQKYKKNKI